MYYLFKEYKGADQLCVYRIADLRLCFRILQKVGFLMTRIKLYIHVYIILAPKTAKQMQEEAEFKEKARRVTMELQAQADDLLKQIQDRLALAQKKQALAATGGTSAENEVTRKALAGDIDMECPSPAKIVRIFTSSTFTGKINLLFANGPLLGHQYSTPLSANGPLLGHLFGFKYFDKITLMYMIKQL